MLSDRLLLVCGVALALQGKPELAEQYRRFLDEEAVYIITPNERDRFLKITRDAERDKFIENFWAVRDPIPETRVNEFKDEHFRRITEANRLYSEARQGWRTERGRMYITLGPPQDVMRYPSQREIYPLEIWYYQDLSIPRFPAQARFMFFRRKGVGEYRLFSPVFDGMKELLADPQARGLLGPLGQIPATFRHLQFMDLEIIDAAEGVAPGYGGQASEEILARVQTPGFTFERLERDLKERVTAAVTFGGDLPVGFRADYFRGEDDFSEVHLAVEIAPEQLHLNQYEKQYRGRIDLAGIVKSLSGEVVDYFEDAAELGVEEAQWEEAKHFAFLYQRKLSLLPGRYQLELLVRDLVSRRLAALNRALSVPAFPSDRLSTSSFVAAFKADEVAPSKRPESLPLAFGGLRLFPRSQGAHGQGQRLLAFLEVYYPKGAPASDSAELAARFVLRRGEETVLDETNRFRPRADAEGVAEVLKAIPGELLTPGKYTLEAEISEPVRGWSDLARMDFGVGERFAVGRLSFVGREELPPAQKFLRQAQQYLAAGRYAEAAARFQVALDYDPSLQGARLGKARAQIYGGEATAGEATARAALAAEPGGYEATTTLGLALARQGRFPEAAATYQEALKMGGESVDLLNALGEARMQAGQRQAALEAFSRSLALKADQAEVRKLLEQLKSQSPQEPR